MPAKLDSLPNELLYGILSYLASDPPSFSKLHEPPSPDIARSPNRALKSLCATSSRFVPLVRPILLAHASVGLEEIDDFLSFVRHAELTRHVVSLVVSTRSYALGTDEDWWRRVLRELDPLRITIVAPPIVIGEAVRTIIMDAHSWAFEVQYQTLQLAQRDDGSVVERFTCPDLRTCPNLLHARKWDALYFNESSSLKAYHHYEYFRHRIPSLLDTWGGEGNVPPPMGSFEALAALRFLTHFRYTAVFPFYNHIRLVLDVVDMMMPNLESLTVQLAPGRNNRVIEHEQRGSMDPNDPWMELSTGYSLIAHAVRDLGAVKGLTRFQACDYDIEALRSNLSTVVGDVLPAAQWHHDGHGTWTKVLPPSDIVETSEVHQAQHL